MLTFPEFTAIFASLFAIALFPLTIQVGLRRVSSQIFFGDGGDEVLARRRAAQSNFTQYVPFALVLLALAEMAGLPSWFIMLNGVMLLLGRALHAYCFLGGSGLGALRAISMLATLTVFPVLGAALIYKFF